jgi:hypothetical protein
MKNLTLLLLMVSTFFCCSKDDETPINPLEKLPQATQIGANKVGCLVNGEVFLPKGSNPLGSPILTCFYQYVNNDWQFGLGFSNNQNSMIRNISIGLNNYEISQGITIILKKNNGNVLNNSYANFTINGGGNGLGYITNDIYKGELKITKLDQVNAIISGAFWFDAVNSNGEKVEIREGRFDMKYSQ